MRAVRPYRPVCDVPDLTTKSDVACQMDCADSFALAGLETGLPAKADTGPTKDQTTAISAALPPAAVVLVLQTRSCTNHSIG